MVRKYVVYLSVLLKSIIKRSSSTTSNIIKHVGAIWFRTDKSAYGLTRGRHISLKWVMSWMWSNQTPQTRGWGNYASTKGPVGWNFELSSASLRTAPGNNPISLILRRELLSVNNVKIVGPKNGFPNYTINNCQQLSLSKCNCWCIRLIDLCTKTVIRALRS